jgi:general secretion pathway protein K
MNINNLPTSDSHQRLKCATNVDKTSGVALIVSLIIMVLVMAMIANFSVNNFRIISRLTNQNIRVQSDGVLGVSIDFGRAILATAGATSTIDTLNDIWAQPFPSTKINGVIMQGYIVDEQSKFNLNNLINDDGSINAIGVQDFQQLLNYINIPEALADNITLYMVSPRIDNDISAYTTANPPYRPAGRPLLDISELLLVQGMKPEWVATLSKYVTAIPVPMSSLIYEESMARREPTANSNPNFVTNNPLTPININTASAEVIAASSGLSLNVAQGIVASRDNKPFNNQQDITSYLSSNGIIVSQQNQNTVSQSVNLNSLSVASSYFTIHAIVDEGEYEFSEIAFVSRPYRSGKWPTVLWQHS